MATAHRVVVPDLLGFGRSLDETRRSFAVDDHLDALDQLADRAGLFERRWTIGAHSMGSALALHWALRHLVIEVDWPRLLADVDAGAGADDGVGDHDYARAISVARPGSMVTMIPNARHHLPMSHPDVCLDQLTDHVGDRRE